ncbi:MAG: hypothetical protein WC222_00240 [Parachlamydiales bacterium]|jgi:hypothetical protein
MNQQTMQNYLSEIHEILNGIEKGYKQKNDLILSILRHQEHYANNPLLQKFFNAESEFYQGDYENSLKNYIQAKTIPFFQFFCYRASAFIAYQRNHFDQALRFVKKAQALIPQDKETQLLYDILQEHTKEEETSQEPLSTHYQVDNTEHSLKQDSSEDETSQNFINTLSSLYQADNVTSHILQDLELPMNSPLSNSGIPPSNAALTRRFYALGDDEEKSSTSIKTHNQETAMSLADLEDTDLHTHNKHTHNIAHDRLNTAEQALEDRIQSFQKQKAQCLNQYVKRARQRKQNLDNYLYVFNGWNSRPQGIQLNVNQEEPSFAHFLLSNNMRKPTTGLYIKWNGKGIVINPGKNFLDQFHRANLNITDIDIVVVTQSDPDAYTDVKEIYDLNYQLNKVSSELQIIQYYLNHKTYFELSHILQPNFKQERNAIHNLELYVDSPDVEKIEITPEVTLNYFPTSTKEALSLHQNDKNQHAQHNSSLGIRFDLKQPSNPADSRKALKLGYISGTSWSPLLSHHLGHCDILFAGFGHTQINDFSKLNYNESCLGYFGTYSLYEEIKPKMLFSCEFDGREGDIRLEISKKIRQETANSQTTENSNVILPADTGLFLDLKNLQIRCSVSEELVDPSLVRVVKSGEAFSNLLYLAPSCFLE